MVSSYPLQWPEKWKRTPSAQRTYARFNTKERNSAGRYFNTKYLTITAATGRILEVLDKMGIYRDDVVVSTNIPTRLDGLPRSDQRAPLDPGVAVYWRKGGNGQMRCIAIDRYTEVAGNLAAVAATLEAMRAIERHGGAEVLERTFTGFAGLPEKASTPWRDVLGVHTAVSLDIIESRFRELAKNYHPDSGAHPDREMFEALVTAREDARKELA